MQHRLSITLVCAAVTGFAGSGAAQELPAPCVGCAGGPLTFVTSGSASYVVNGNVGTITQDTERAILNWRSFNVGADSTVNFVQPSSTSAALNRIFQGDPSRILGRLNANGQVFLINQNGVVFGQGSQVNVSSLVASSLDIDDKIFTEIGLTNAINQGEQAANARAAFESVGISGDIRVESGAKIKSGEGGRILLIGATVENRGELSSPGGQAILAAAKDKVYLAESEDPNLRGLLVEIDTGGEVKNLGSILTERGNTTLIGHAVNQSGRISATTSVNLNGSVRLLARDGADPNQFTTVNGKRTPVVTRTGTLTLGSGSVIEVLPEQSDATAVDGQAQPRSRIEMMGRTVTLESGTRIRAPGGNVSLTATSRPDLSAVGEDEGAQIYIAEGSSIDVSGDTSAQIAMQRNQATVRLFGNELADSPTQRGGPLSRRDITIDIRRGTPFANVAVARENVKRTAAERLSLGGEITMRSAGDVIVNPGSSLDVSGGKVTYLPGVLSTSRLVTLDGRVVDISEADPNILYRGFAGEVIVRHNKWGVVETFQLPGGGVAGEYHEGYVEGKDAGSVNIEARRLALNGTLRGESTRGFWQRDPASTSSQDGQRAHTEVPLAGRLSVANVKEISLAETVPAQAYAPGDLLSPTDPFILALSRVRDGGFNRLNLRANDRLTVPEDVELSLGGGADIRLEADEVEIEGDIRSAGGKVGIFTNASATERGQLRVAGSAQIDVSGEWVNDVLDAPREQSQPLRIHGGSVTLQSAGDLYLEAGSRIDVDGGAHLEAGGDVTAGKGGSISLAVRRDEDEEPLVLDNQAVLSGYALERGGRLSIRSNSFRISNDGAPSEIAGEMALSPEFFGRGGFSEFAFTADRGSFEITDGTQLQLRAENLVLSEDYASRESGADLTLFTQRATLLDHERGPTSLSVNVARQVQLDHQDAAVRIGRGAYVSTEAGGSIKLSSDTDVFIDGTLSTPSGRIGIELITPGGPVANNTGYRADQGIYIGSQAQLLARGTVRLEPDSQGLRTGEVLAGGEIAMRANRGYIFAREGSLLDVSGASHVLDLALGNGTQATPVASDAGAIRLTAAEGMFLTGQLLGRAGGAGASGGTLSVTLDTTERGEPVVPDPAQQPFLHGAREVIIAQQTRAFAGADRVPVPDSLNGQAQVSADMVHAGGITSLELNARPVVRNNDFVASAIRMEGDVQLTLPRSLRLDAEVIASSGGAALLDAAYVGIGPSGIKGRPVTTPIEGAGSLTVEAGHIDLFGATTLTGFASAEDGAPSVNLVSRGDIRTIGVRLGASEPSRGLPGSLTSAVSFGLNAAQIYPATLTDFAFRVTGEDGKIVIGTNGASAARPLSAAGRLTFSAPEIVQEGVLRAPFGEIVLDAGEALRLAPGSITSTSGAGQVIPFGTTEFGEHWTYQLADLKRVFESAPDKSVVLRGEDIALEAGATIDVRGGGELTAYEFTPGTGGTRDILATDNPAGSFAVVPTVGRYGAADVLADPNLKFEPGSTIFLAGGNGLPAGEYAILPARYALLPGAFLITPVDGTQDMSPAAPQVVTDGSTIVAGRRGFVGGDIRETRWSGYRVETGAQMRQRAEYLESKASKFFAGTEPRTLPADAGRLAIDAGTSALLRGTLQSSAASGGRGGQVELLADSIAIVAETTGSIERVEFVAADLNALNAETLIVGACRRAAGEEEGSLLEVAAETVSVDAGAALTGTEILIAARDEIVIAGGASVSANGAKLERTETEYRVTGDGAFARVSTGAQARVERKDAPSAGGRLQIEENGVLAASGSITLEASADLISAGELRVSGGSLSLASSRVSLGDVDGVDSGLVLGNDDLAAFQARELILRSRSSIDIYGAASADLDVLKLDAAALRGIDNDGASVSLSAREIELRNSLDTPAGDAALGSGTLSLTAQTVTLGGGEIAVSGFDSVTVSGAKQITGRDTAGLLVAGDLDLITAALSGEAGAELAYRASGDLVTSRRDQTAAPTDVDLGVRLTLTGANVTHGTSIVMPSGEVKLQATAEDGRVVLGNGATIDVAGRDMMFHDMRMSSHGGSVRLLAQQGAVEIGNDVLLDVSGAPSGGHAGKLIIASPAAALRVGENVKLRGAAASGYRGGSALIDSHSLASAALSSLNSQLNGGGFTERRDLRLRNGDITLAAGESIVARNVSVTADGGRIDVAGAIDARGGRVELYARDDVALHGSARINARASTAGEDGGLVRIGTQAGTIDVRAGATIDVSGAASGSGTPQDSGRVHLRAPRVDNSVAITAVAGTIRGAERVDIEAFRVYETSDLDAGLLGQIQLDTADYMSNAPAILGGLGVDTDPRFHVLAGVEVRSLGDLRVGTAVDLMDWRYGEGDTGVLTLRAAGDLMIDNSISDGFRFERIVSRLPGRDVVQTGDSWSYQLVAGADLTSARPLSVDGSGSFTLADGRHVRTGTGDIEIAAAGDVTLAGLSSAIYTAGERRELGAYEIEVYEQALRADLVHHGGDIRIEAGGSVRGQPGQVLADWVARHFGVTRRVRPPNNDFPLMWGIDFAAFRQGVGALAGGDVTIVAGGDAESFSAAIGTTGVPYAKQKDQADVRVEGGGSLTIDVAGDLRGGVYTVMRGSAAIRAGDAIRSAPFPGGRAGINPVLQVGDAPFELIARTDAALNGVFNPTVAPRDPGGWPATDTFFFTYTDRAAVSVTAHAGEVGVAGSNGINPYLPPGLTTTQGLHVYPGTLKLASLSGDIVINADPITLFPTAKGTLDLIAAGDIATRNNARIVLSDGDSALLPSIEAPSNDIAATPQLLDGHAKVPVHHVDIEPVRLIARDGVIGPRGFAAMIFSLAKPARVYAGEDVRNLNLSVQHDDVNDFSVVEAGRDIAFPSVRDGNGNVQPNTNRIEVHGPGHLYLLAGRDIDLGASFGIRTHGDLVNPALPDSGASVTLLTGMAQAANYQGFIERYLQKSDAYHKDLAAFLERFPDAGAGSPLERFARLDPLHQRELLHRIFFNELRQAGIDETSGKIGSFQRGYDAIDTLFPNPSKAKDAYRGDLKSFLSQITTLDGGDINLLVPGGLINAGVATSTAQSKTPDQLGIVVQRDGDINGFVDEHFLVNQSRVFVLDGGDITLWSSFGDLDAGRGARAALAIPPPRIRFDEKGNPVVEFPPAIAGSGIRAAVTTPGRKPGDVYLFAPKGVVNAGDAGIGSAGNLTIGAVEVIGADNIDVGGIAVGVPVESGGLGASLTGVSSTAASASKAAAQSMESDGREEEQQASLADTALSWLEVFVVGLGEDNCRQDDVECLKRQRMPPP